MIIKHNNKEPKIATSAYIAPNACICGDVSIGENVRILFGAQIIAEGSSISIGDNCIVLENAVLRSTENHPLNVGENCLIGPHTHIAGCTIEDSVFVATGASVFHGAILKTGSEVRINGVVHLKTVLPKNGFVPIGWIAVGNPAKILPPNQHDAIWKIQEPLNFPKEVYGIDRSKGGEQNNMEAICREMGKRLGKHRNDV